MGLYIENENRGELSIIMEEVQKLANDEQKLSELMYKNGQKKSELGRQHSGLKRQLGHNEEYCREVFSEVVNSATNEITGLKQLVDFVNIYIPSSKFRTVMSSLVDSAIVFMVRSPEDYEYDKARDEFHKLKEQIDRLRYEETYGDYDLENLINVFVKYVDDVRCGLVKPSNIEQKYSNEELLNVMQEVQQLANEEEVLSRLMYESYQKKSKLGRQHLELKRQLGHNEEYCREVFSEVVNSATNEITGLKQLVNFVNIYIPSSKFRTVMSSLVGSAIVSMVRTPGDYEYDKARDEFHKLKEQIDRLRYEETYGDYDLGNIIEAFVEYVDDVRCGLVKHNSRGNR